MARAMKDSGVEWIGEIPEGWQLSRLGWCLEEIKEKNDPIRTSNVVSLTNKLGVIPYEEKGNQGNKAKEDYSQYGLAFENTLVINSMNVLIGSVGISKYYGCVSPVYYVFKNTDKADLRFINYLFQNVGFQKELRKYANGILEIRLRISSHDMLRRIIPLPDIREQESICDYLDAECSRIDAVIEQTRASIEEYRKLKQSIITQAVTKGIRPGRKMKDSGVEWIGEVPEEWSICKLRHIGSTQNGISKGGEYFGEGYPFVSYGDVYRNYSLPHTVRGLIKSTEEERALYSVLRGDIFFTRTSETIEEVGFSSVCETTIPNATFAGFLIRVRPYDDTLDVGYSKYYFRSNHHRFYLVKQMNLVTRASLGQPLLKGMPVLVPGKEEQREIARYLDQRCGDIDNLILSKEKVITELESYKKSLIFEHVTGKKEVFNGHGFKRKSS